jgi:hypothetical protein
MSIMEQRNIPLQDTSLEQLNQFDNSISHWSTELVLLDLKRKALLENVDGLYQGRQALLNNIVTEAGIDPSQIVKMQPVGSPDGKVNLAVVIKPKAPTAPPAPPSNGAPDSK